ncbi:hypothetical protein ACFQAT_01835 [Undibacterium arcticum]|uniref:hypothetical protein n=1 Tax=Undibacterium arcticum TaxID=1762892 RepID=UPI00360CFD8E
MTKSVAGRKYPLPIDMRNAGTDTPALAGWRVGFSVTGVEILTRVDCAVCMKRVISHCAVGCNEEGESTDPRQLDRDESTDKKEINAATPVVASGARIDPRSMLACMIPPARLRH